MNDGIALPGRTEIVIASGREALHAVLTLPAAISALAVLAHAGFAPRTRDDALAAILRHAGIGTLTLDLLTQGEKRFADVQHNVSLLARRLLDALTMLKHRTQQGELPLLPIALCAFDDCSPVAVRVAALRDHDVFAVVCHNGMIDRAGMLYLRSLESPLLVLLDDDDDRLIASGRRALREVACQQSLVLVPAAAESPHSAGAFEVVARETARWLVTHRPRRQDGTS
ncbi:MAG TPA: hypothetical protein PLS67_04850 [Accumulibacter sp.]|jgi:hypothetical protein|nr:hypothetical protein [Accumulibacter sp.]HQC79834.1 hypothetical protein [Accumulibacter sp.]